MSATRRLCASRPYSSSLLNLQETYKNGETEKEGEASRKLTGGAKEENKHEK